MLLFITAVRIGTPADHDRITDVKWLRCDKGTSGVSDVKAMVQWLRESTNRAQVADSDEPAEVRVVDANPPYLRTVANGQWSDNLLALPRF
jgi:hypothetical protein